ncbi:rubrerythrin [Limisalsivibrio acetivorans]|uniref:rubrerythrin n=1 Tax=Limisalsivibrio acetivorans TaxID=1304888 RepID=UPI0003B2F91D|nr:rubrerythrin family protein [Limisalsivibrio acetivorans]
MPKLEGTETLENLMKAFAGESQARMRYTYYASVARQEGYRQIEAIFTETADNEREHAKRFWKKILENADTPTMVNVNADYPVGFAKTIDNLKLSAEGEHEEWEILYPNFAKVAEEEGFPHIAKQFRYIADVEVEHEKRFLKLADNIENGLVFKKDVSVRWKCRNCGFVHEGLEAPDICPACAHKLEHFEVKESNY